MTGPTARDPLLGEPEHRQRWRDAPSAEASASTLRALLGSVASGAVMVEDAARLVESWPSSARRAADGPRPQWIRNVIGGARADVAWRRRSGPHFVGTLLAEIDRLDAALAAGPDGRLRHRLREVLGIDHDVRVDDDGLIVDVAEWIRRARAFAPESVRPGGGGTGGQKEPRMRCAPECSEMHTYTPGECEAAAAPASTDVVEAVEFLRGGWQPRGHCEHTKGESMFRDAQPGPDAEQAGECTCVPCTSGWSGHPAIEHCAACCYGSLVEEFDPDCPFAEHREMAARQFPSGVTTAEQAGDVLPGPFADDITGTTLDVTTVRRRRWDAEQAGGKQT